MRYFVKAFYPDHSFNNGRTIGCIVYLDEDQHKADRVRDHLRKKGGDVHGLYFTHNEQGRGTTSLETHYLSD